MRNTAGFAPIQLPQVTWDSIDTIRPPATRETPPEVVAQPDGETSAEGEN